MKDDDQLLEQLLGEASPRPVPDVADVAQVRSAVHAEWRATTGRRRTRRNALRLGLAASVVLGVFALVGTLRVADVDVVEVAIIEKSFGSIYVMGEASTLTLTDKLTAIHTGQTIVTGDDAGMALAWSSGGSVRLDKNTEVEFSADNRVRLRAGRVYFDSQSSGFSAGISGGGTPSFSVETDYGAVTHIGTQFMTEVSPAELTVSVREGMVEVSGRQKVHTVSSGKQAVYTGQRRPVELDIDTYGAAWDWVAQTSPAVVVDGESAHRFLQWVGRELGLSVRYNDAAVEEMAKNAIQKGRVDTDPAEALRLRMLIADLTWHIEEGTIYVSDSE